MKFVGNMRASMTCPAEDWKVCVMLGDLMVDPAASPHLQDDKLVSVRVRVGSANELLLVEMQYKPACIN